MDYGPLFELIRSRRSIRRYTAEPVPGDTVRRLLDAAAWAPSAHNRQPWRFVVLSSADGKARLAQAMGDRLRADRLADGDPSEAVEADVSRSYTRITSSAFVIVFCLTMEEMDRYPDSRRNEAEHTMAVQGTAMSAQILMLAAQAEGLGACWLCAPLFSPEVVRSVVGMPADWEPQGLITLGHPEGEPKLKSRRPLGEVTLWR